MPVSSKEFYAQKAEKDEDEDGSESRWPQPKFQSEVVIPPSIASEPSEPLSAPSEGFSAPICSVTTSPAKSSNTNMLQRTRFSRSMARKAVGGVTISSLWQQFKPPHQLEDVIKLPSIPSQSKCAQWILGSGPGEHAPQAAGSHEPPSCSQEKNATPIKSTMFAKVSKLVEYSPTSTSTLESRLTNRSKDLNSSMTSSVSLSKRKMKIMSMAEQGSSNHALGLSSTSMMPKNSDTAPLPKRKLQLMAAACSSANQSNISSESENKKHSTLSSAVKHPSNVTAINLSNSEDKENYNNSSGQEKQIFGKRKPGSTSAVSRSKHAKTNEKSSFSSRILSSNKSYDAEVPVEHPSLAEEKELNTTAEEDLDHLFAPELSCGERGLSPEERLFEEIQPAESLGNILVSSPKQGLTPYAKLRMNNMNANALEFKQKYGINIPINDTTVGRGNCSLSSSDTQSKSSLGSIYTISDKEISSSSESDHETKSKRQSSGKKIVSGNKKHTTGDSILPPATAKDQVTNLLIAKNSAKLTAGAKGEKLPSAAKPAAKEHAAISSASTNNSLPTAGARKSCDDHRNVTLPLKPIAKPAGNHGAASSAKDFTNPSEPTSVCAKRNLFQKLPQTDVKHRPAKPLGKSSSGSAAERLTHSALSTQPSPSAGVKRSLVKKVNEKPNKLSQTIHSHDKSSDVSQTSTDNNVQSSLCDEDFEEQPKSLNESLSSVVETDEHQRAPNFQPPFEQDASDTEEPAHIEFDLSEPLSDGDINDHEQAALLKPQPKVALKRERKSLRNSGQAYTRINGTTVAKRSPKPIHKCSRLKCNEIITPEIASDLCSEFWKLSDLTRQRQYIASKITYATPKRRRSRVESEQERIAQFRYNIDIEGVRYPVCKSTFLDTYCLSEKMVRTVTDSMISSSCNVPPASLRGHHAPTHKLNPQTEAAIKKHIDSFPSYVSHYTRAQSSSLYFASGLNFRIMYDLYLETESPRVSFSTYYTRVKQCGRKFKKGNFATCSTCDRLKLELEATTDAETRKSLLIQQERHHRKAEQAYNVKRKMKMEAEKDPTLRVLVYDMEKCLPCPYLKNKTFFYQRQLNVFNITVCDTTTKLTHNYMWHEVEGGRSANAIASCLYKHLINEIPPSVTRVVIFSDACTSQNRNSHVAAMYHVALQQHESLQSIEHIFLVPGHTHLEVDNKHSVIERFKDKQQKISHPDEYYALVEEAGRADKNFPDGKFFAVRMHKNFYDFSALLAGPLIKRDTTLNKRKFNWLETNWFKYSKCSIGLVQVKSSFNIDAHFDQLSFLRKGVKPSTLQSLEPYLQKCYTRPQAISLEKKTDLLSMFPFIDVKYHLFYTDLPASHSVQDVDPDLQR